MTIELLYSKFNIVNEFTKFGSVIGDLSGTKVKVDKNDVKFILYFVPLVELGGVVYLVCNILDVEDDCEVKETYVESIKEFAGSSGGRRYSYDNVATFGWR